MSDLKRTVRVKFWKIFLVSAVAGWVLLMYIDPRKLPPESPLAGYWYAIGMICIVFGFLISVFGWQAQIKSAKTVHCHGSDTWDPAEWHEIPAEESDGEIITPRLLIRGVGGFKALGIYVGGKGAKGWDVVVDFPGIWFRRGANLVLNTDTRETFVGAHEHDDIANTIDKMNRYILGIPGMISIADDTPINVYAIPADYPGIPKDALKHFASLKKAEDYFSERLAAEKATNTDLRMKLSALRGADHGIQNWKESTRGKGMRDRPMEGEEDGQ